jgi:small-conductance mechanosensitive channel
VNYLVYRFLSPQSKQLLLNRQRTAVQMDEWRAREEMQAIESELLSQGSGMTHQEIFDRRKKIQGLKARLKKLAATLRSNERERQLLRRYKT